MNIYMKNIDYSLSKPQVVRGLAQVLHQGPFQPSSDGLINFDVHLLRRRNPVRNNNGTGILTFPTIEIGQAFLASHGSDNPAHPVQIGARVIKFLPSNQRLNDDLVAKLRSRPFSGPPAQRRRPHVPRDVVKVNSLQFGWICRDYSFSVECQEDCGDRCDITFENGSREIHIKFRLEDAKYLIVISFSSIVSISALTNTDREHSLVFALHTPPSYEQERETNGNKHIPPRLKLPHLSIPDHDRVAPFTSLAIRLLCDSENGLSDFLALCRKAELHRVDDHDYPVVRRNLFSLPVMERIQVHLQELDWVVAFQMESLLRSMAIDFQEADVLLPEITQTVAQRGKDFTAIAIRNFKTKAKYSLFSEDDTELDIVQSFRQTVTELELHGDILAPRPTDGSLYESFHVEVTPTTLHLEGPFPDQSNRVIRAYDTRYHECFLRVSFLDEGHLHYRFDRKVDGHGFIQYRVGSVLHNGLYVAGRTFEFLAYSQSALKEHAVW